MITIRPFVKGDAPMTEPVSGHGHALRVLALAWLDVPVMFGQSFQLDVASVSILGHERESPAILRRNS